MLRIRRGHRSGYAMALMLVVLMVVTTITVTVVSTAVRDQEASRTAAARSEARLLGLYALEEFAARVAADPSLPAAALAVKPGGIRDDVHPALRLNNEESWTPLPMPESRTPAGAADCETFLIDCYHLTLPLDAVLPQGNVNPVAFTVTATVRVRCAGSETRCVYASFQQRLRSAQFFDFMLSHELTALAPEALFASGSLESVDAAAYAAYKAACSERASVRADVSFPPLSRTVGVTTHTDGTYVPSDSVNVGGCVDIAYQSDSANGDTLQGPIYTTDDYITVCDSPTLGDVFISGPGFYGEVYRPSLSCGPATPPPGATWVVNQPYLVQPTSEKVLNDALAGVSDVLEFMKADPAVPVEIRFTPGEVAVSGVDGGPTLAEYAGKVIVIRAPASNWGSVDVLVSGTVAGVVSVVVDGSVAIDDDLVYAGAVTEGCVAPNGSQHDGACLAGLAGEDADVLSLTATERIEIWQECQNPGDQSCTNGSSANRFVHGVFTSPQGYIGVPDWQENIDTTAATAARGTLYVYGSVASRFQGVYGSYGPAIGGVRSLLSGFNKGFTHDDRLTRFTRGENTLAALPPYIVKSRIPVWVRLDVSEVAVNLG